MKEMKMKWIRQRLDWISRKIIILSKIIIGFGKYLWKLFKKIMKVIWKGGLKMKALIFWLLCLTGLLAGLVIGTIFFGWIFLVVTFGALVFLVILIYFVLAKKNLFFTFVEEGTAKAVVRGATFKKVTTPEGKVYKVTKGGQFRRALIQWRGYTLDRKSNVVEGRERWHPFGGLRYYGFWPFDQIYTYIFQWTGVAENGEIQSHPKEKLDYILLKDDIYWAEVENAEDEELLPLNVEVILTQRVVNPRKALFAVQSWLETIVNRIKPAVRDSITSKPYKLLIQKTEAIGEEIYGKLEEELLEKEFLDRYGIDVRKIEVKEINPREEYRDATLKKWLGQREAEARAAATTGTLLEMITEQTGISLEDIQKMLRENPEGFITKYKDLLTENLDLIKRRMAIDGNAFLDVKTDNPIQDLIALWKRMPVGNPQGEGEKGMPEGKGKEEKKEETEEERIKKLMEKTKEAVESRRGAKAK